MLNLRFSREEQVADQGEGPGHCHASQHANGEVVESGIVVTQQVFLGVIPGEGVPEAARHGRLAHRDETVRNSVGTLWQGAGRLREARHGSHTSSALSP
mmetsp:Transcript_18140/g.32541  ORF Transcript_18140/g.32541 Transcript_18140/m.32541 type:complete len:99 (+) Transcript_18140:2008-2304(+)